jgi:hypothetical protein
MGVKLARFRGYLWVAPLLIPALYLFAGGNAFAYPGVAAEYSDLVTAHYPAAHFIQSSLRELGRIPFWQPTSLGGSPFWANPLSGVFYPPGWLALMLPLPLGFNVAAGVHLLFGGLGMALWLRSQGVTRAAALLGGLALAAMPKLMAHYGAGHLTLLYALSWTPWLLYWRAGWKAGAALALIFLADPRWAVYAGVVWLVYRLGQQPAHSRSWGREIASALGSLSLSALWSAPLAVPMLELVWNSTRVSLSAKEAAVYSLPPARLLSLFAPDFGGFHEWAFYLGGGILCLALIAALDRQQRSNTRMWLPVVGLSLLAALGSHFPPADWLLRLPGLSWLRVPARALFLTDFALIVLAAYGLQALLGGFAEGDQRRCRLALTALAGFAAALAAGVSLMSGQPASGFWWGAGMLLASSLWLGWKLRHGGMPLPWLAGLFLLLLLDWGQSARAAISFRPAERVYAQGDKLALALSGDQGLFRVYSPSNSLPAHSAVRAGLQSADGVDPLQLSSYASFMAAASGVPSTGYSVTIPPYANGDPRRDNQAYTPEARLLGLLNVRYVAAEFNLPAEGLEFRGQYGETRLYENSYALPRAWVQADGRAAGEGATPAAKIEWQPDRVQLRARGPGRLVLSEIVYPGWQAWVDGAPAEIEPAAGLLRSVRLDEGEHVVLFAYRPFSLAVGAALFCAGCLLAWAGRRFTGRRAGRQGDGDEP